MEKKLSVTLENQKQLTNVQEKEKNTQVFILYRDNDLFKEYVPEITSILNTDNVPFAIHSFAQNTVDREIAEWLKQNKSNLAGRKVISDYKCMSVSSAFFSDFFKGSSTYNMEKFLSDMTMRKVFGKNIFEAITQSDDSVEIHQEAISKTLTVVFENYPEIKPSKVYLVKQNLSDHFPFHSSPVFQSKPLEKEPEAYLSDILSKIGIPEIEIINSMHDVPKDIFDLSKSNKQSVMADRHALNKFDGGLYSYSSAEKTVQLGRQGRLFILPFESLYSLLTQCGFIFRDEHTDNLILREILKKQLITL